MTSMTSHTAILKVSLKAIGHNWSIIKNAYKGTHCGAVIKCNAYGLGAEPIFKSLQSHGCEYFYVATLSEALLLCPHAQKDSRIIVLNGFNCQEIDLYQQNHLIPVLNTLEQIKQYALHGRNNQCKYPAMIHLDTGMNRLGLSAAQVNELIKDPHILENIEILSWMSHPSCAYIGDPSVTHQQFELFEKWTHQLPQAPLNFCNSSALLKFPQYHKDYARVGMALYAPDFLKSTYENFQCVVTLQAPIIQTRWIEKNETVGYGQTWRAKKRSRIATISLGYGDGYPLCSQNTLYGQIDGYMAPLVGKVSMDTLTLDITNIPHQIGEGQYISMINDKIKIKDISNSTNIDPYDLLTQFGSRLKRVYD